VLKSEDDATSLYGLGSTCYLKDVYCLSSMFSSSSPDMSSIDISSSECGSLTLCEGYGCPLLLNCFLSLYSAFAF
jgi:hypothetical protein